MKNKKMFAVALTAIATLTLSAAQSVFDFETVVSENPILSTNTGSLDTATNKVWSGGVESTYDSLSNDGRYSASLTVSGHYLGGVISNSKSNAGTTFENDVDSMAGGGANGSSNFGVIYGGTFKGASMSTKYSNNTYYTALGHVEYLPPDYSGSPVSDSTTSIIVNEALAFSTIDVSLTSYGYYGLNTGNSNMGEAAGSTAFDKIYNNVNNSEGSFFVLRIYAVDTNWDIDESRSLDVILAENNAGSVFIMDGWNTIDISALNDGEGLCGLSFQLLSSFGNEHGMTNPSYIAIDNLTYSTIPEPATCAAAFGAIALAFAAYRRRK